jgi:hypothetical protein
MLAGRTTAFTPLRDQLVIQLNGQRKCMFTVTPTTDTAMPKYQSPNAAKSLKLFCSNCEGRQPMPPKPK